MVVERSNHQCVAGMTWPLPNLVNLNESIEWVAIGGPFFL